MAQLIFVANFESVFFFVVWFFWDRVSCNPGLNDLELLILLSPPPRVLRLQPCTSSSVRSAGDRTQGFVLARRARYQLWHTQPQVRIYRELFLICKHGKKKIWGEISTPSPPSFLTILEGRLRRKREGGRSEARPAVPVRSLLPPSRSSAFIPKKQNGCCH